MSSTQAPAPPSLARVLRGYGPLVAFAALFGLMAAFLPTTVREAAPALETSDPTEVTTTIPGTEGTDGTQGTGGTPGTTRPGEGTVQTDPARPQIPGDPYSPPLVEFQGDNGGATSRGVTSDEITVSARILNERGFQQTLAVLAGADILDGPADIRRTIEAYAEYLNERFQFYGRKLNIVFYNGRGSSTTELLGGGQAEAQADAIEAAQTIEAFAEINGASAPFADALANQGVLAFGTPYLSRGWHLDRAPYNWSIASDCSVVAETGGEYYVKLLAGKTASFAGPGLNDKTRKLAGLSPENPWYAECHDDFERVIREGGFTPEVRINYRLDIPSMSNQAANVVARLKSEQATSVFCGCDPIFPVWLTSKAAEQGYHPEWVLVGVALTDHDITGQLMEQSQWARASGVSYAGSILPLRAGLGYAAYKQVRNDEPAFQAEIIYAQMYMLALGIQMAGPNLTPHTYEQGMRRYPGGTGFYGTWGFPQGTYTPQRDTRIIWYDPERLSTYNRKRGAFVEAYGGQRFPLGQLPTGEPDIFNP